MLNPIALVLLALGGLMVVGGVVLVMRRRMVLGLLLVGLGIAVGAVPWLASFFLAR